MKPRRSNQRNRALTITEVVVVVSVIGIFIAIFLPALAASKRRGCRINCTNNVKQIGLAFREWAGDNGDRFPMDISVANGGTKELAAAGDVVASFQIMSNELSTPKILVCPDDTKRFPGATDFSSGLKNHISSFIGLDARTNSPQALLSGDDHFEIGGVPVKSGLLVFSTNAPLAWTSGRHDSGSSYFRIPGGNILFADGSVQSPSVSGLKNYLVQTGLATNRLAIP